MQTITPIAGVRLRGAWSDEIHGRCRAWLDSLGLDGLTAHESGTDAHGAWQRFWLRADALPPAPGWAAGDAPGASRADGPGPADGPVADDLIADGLVADGLSGQPRRGSLDTFDTADLARRLRLQPDVGDRDLDAEILAALLLSPLAFEFPSLDEWQSAVRLRRFIVQTGRRTVLAFDTEQAERPDCWSWTEATGFILLPGFELIPALEQTLWPDLSGRTYSFSCYRATEYVLLLALAKELRISHPQALAALQAQWQKKAIQSGAFHDAFLHEYGSLQAPLPMRYYVPGDRLWFRNPDEASAGVEGYEGSWVFYLGQGHFTNFWKPDQPYTLQSKCIELYHWRDGLRFDRLPVGAASASAVGGAPGQDAGNSNGNGNDDSNSNGDGLRMGWIDESIVEAQAARTLADPQATQRVLARMMRLRDPAGVYAEGGCIDASREAVRCVRPATWSLGLTVSSDVGSRVAAP